jgi:asparagine synthase (glutamine-hydrolysing)
MDEPFHSPNMETSQRLWKQMASQGIRVSINGAAADECFGGYPGMYHIPQLSRMLESGRLVSLHREAAKLSEAPAAPLSALYLSRLRKAVVHSIRTRFPGLDRKSPTVMATYARAGRVLGGAPRATLRRTENLDDLLLGNMTDWMMNYWLRSGHQNFMGVPVEVRAPFLDHRVVEFGFRLPTSFLMRDGWLKWIIREAVKDIMPDEVTWRRNKMGFPFPYETWLPANKQRFFAMVEGDECPHLDIDGLRGSYDVLAASDPTLLWRAMSVCLWWKRCVLGRPLEAALAGSARA